MSPNWDDLRKAARHLENDIDLKLVAISKVGSNSSISSSSSDTAPLLGEHVFDTLAMEIEQILDRLTAINDKMSELQTTGTANLHTRQRHRDILHGYRQEFNKIRTNHTTRIEREELLKGSGMMGGTSISGSSGGGAGGLSRRDMFLKESNHLHNSHNLINEQINIAIETREHLSSQRQYLKKIQTRFNDIANRFPLISSLIQRINIKQRRDTLIVGGTIGVCLFLLLLYAFN